MRILIQSKTFCYEEICISKRTFEIYLSIYNIYHILLKYKLRFNKLTILNINDIIKRFLFYNHGNNYKDIKYYV
jgi:hypothetical protein